MKATEIINKIKGIVGVELADETVKLAEEKLENGTILVAEEFKEGEAVFIKSDDEQIALPVGEYILEDSRVLVVKEEGLIADVREVSDDVPAEEKEEVEAKDSELAEDDEADVRDWAGMEKRIKNLEIAVAKLKEAKEGGDTEVEASEEIKEENTELSTEEAKEDKVVEEVTELSATKEEAVEPIKHNPESEEKKLNRILFGQKRTETTRDRVFSKIANN